MFYLDIFNDIPNKDLIIIYYRKCNGFVNKYLENWERPHANSKTPYILYRFISLPYRSVEGTQYF